jgi:hypothetical protein
MVEVMLERGVDAITRILTARHRRDAAALGILSRDLHAQREPRVLVPSVDDALHTSHDLVASLLSVRARVTFE